MFFGGLVEVLARFEEARRVLGHAVVLDREELGQIVTGDKPEAVLERYETALLPIYREEVDRNEGDFPNPVLPRVDPARGVVEHITCTGRTIIRLSAYQPGSFGEPCRGSFAIFRLHGSPLDPEDERDRQLIALVAD